jgi:hypothetical protein
MQNQSSDSPRPPVPKVNCMEGATEGFTQTSSTPVRYRVEPLTAEGCDCEDCRAGRHLYALYRGTAQGSEWSAMSLQGYTSAEECKRKHWWGIDFGPNAVWEDGTPVVEPDPTLEKSADEPQPDANGMVPLNGQALQRSLEALEKHRPTSGRL